MPVKAGEGVGGHGEGPLSEALRRKRSNVDGRCFTSQQIGDQPGSTCRLRQAKMTVAEGIDDPWCRLGAPDGWQAVRAARGETRTTACRPASSVREGNPWPFSAWLPSGGNSVAIPAPPSSTAPPNTNARRKPCDDKTVAAKSNLRAQVERVSRQWSCCSHARFPAECARQGCARCGGKTRRQIARPAIRGGCRRLRPEPRPRPRPAAAP